jgi:hypothetical protein
MIGFYILCGFVILCLLGIKSIDPNVVYQDNHYRIRRVNGRYIIEMNIGIMWIQICDTNTEQYFSFDSKDSALEYLNEEKSIDMWISKNPD